MLKVLRAKLLMSYLLYALCMTYVWFLMRKFCSYILSFLCCGKKMKGLSKKKKFFLEMELICSVCLHSATWCSGAVIKQRTCVFPTSTLYAIKGRAGMFSGRVFDVWLLSEVWSCCFLSNCICLCLDAMVNHDVNVCR